MWTPFGMGRIPCDNRIRRMPDGVPPEHFDGVFSAIVADPGSRGAVGMRCPDGHMLAASDGSEYCGRRPTRRVGGEVEFFHGFVCASSVAPCQSRALPSAPEFVCPRGRDRQTGLREPRGAGRRWPGLP